MPDWTSSDGSVTLMLGDCLTRMAEIPDGSVDCVVTDPPYGIRFMGKAWDGQDIEETAQAIRGLEQERLRGGRRPLRSDTGRPFDRSSYAGSAAAAGQYDRSLKGNHTFQEWCYAWAVAALRVLKPGGHLLAFGGTRTHHRLMCALEDAGFEIRDTLTWLYGSGFPKSLDVSKAIDKAAGVERTEVTGERHRNVKPFDDGAGWNPNSTTGDFAYTAPSTDAARQWGGWGTTLKPAWEPIVLARKPLMGTVAANVQAHGTGALNVDGCRIGPNPGYCYPKGPGGNTFSVGDVPDGSRSVPVESTGGRWPANVVLDEDAAAMLDGQSGERVERAHLIHRGERSVDHKYGGYPNQGGTQYLVAGDSGGASRFFYCAKASREEREAGVAGEPQRRSDGRQKDIENPRLRTSPRRNAHPTVKPVDLMRWLVRLVTPPGGVILDPFIGSGTTAIAAVLEGFRCVGIDNNAEYLATAQERVERAILEREHGTDGADAIERGQLTMEV